MPIYEYECPKCGIMEISQCINDEPLKKCPNCKRKIKRLISLNNFILKGSGWYATDYAGKSNGSNGGSNGKSAGQKSECKEEKPAKKKESSDSKTTSAGTSSD